MIIYVPIHYVLCSYGVGHQIKIEGRNAFVKRLIPWENISSIFARIQKITKSLNLLFVALKA